MQGSNIRFSALHTYSLSDTRGPVGTLEILLGNLGDTLPGKFIIIIIIFDRLDWLGYLRASPMYQCTMYKSKNKVVKVHPVMLSSFQMNGHI